MKKYKYAFFDLDGTLTNSEKGIAHCIRLALDSIGIHDVTDERIKEMIGPPFRVSMKVFYGLDGEPVDKMLKVYRGQYDLDGWRENEVYGGVKQLLKTLKDSGIILAVATSKPIKFTLKIVDYFGLSEYFSYVGAAECDGSRETKREVIESVIENLGITDRSEVLMIGDRKYDVAGAKEAGVDCMGILWGFGDRTELETEGADYIEETPEGVADFFAKRQ